MRPPAWLVVVLVGAGLGLLFAGISTYDFVQHLDRQVHNLHCSFIPGVTHAADASSGCQIAMMSPYSSILRTHVWGGIPIALGAMSVFAFIAFYALDLMVTRRKDDAKATLFLLAATVLPVIASLVMLTISLTKLGTTCKLCVAIYLSSALVFIGALQTWRRARAAGTVGMSRSGSHRLEIGVAAEPTRTGFLGAMLGLGVLFVVIPLAIYLEAAPDNSKFIGTCESLTKPDDPYGVMVNVHRTTKGAPALEILDPLCPACKAFEQRLEASGFDDKLDRRAVMFPLDTACNWMITETTHPGACTVSEAVLCAGDKAPEVIAWAFEMQDQIRTDTAKDPGAAARYVKAKFPALAACVGSPEARSKLNKSLRWSVANNIHVLTPQLFIDNTKLCDEDVDLGLEFALGIMLDRHAKGTLAPPASVAPPPPPVKKPEPEPAPIHKKAPRAEDKPVETPAQADPLPAEGSGGAQ